MPADRESRSDDQLARSARSTATCRADALTRADANVDDCRDAADSGDWASTIPGVDDEIGAGDPQELDEAGDRSGHPVRIDAAIEAERRLAAQAEAGGGLGDADRLEPGDLERDRRGRVADLAVEPAHDPADADRRVGGVADQQIVGGQRPLDTVERHHRLAVDGAADAEPAAAERSRS